MAYEIDFMPVGDKASSGDAICLRYGDEYSGYRVHLIDGGYASTSESIMAHLRTFYTASDTINNMVLTHADGDHAAGLVKILEDFTVGALWMNRPWLYAAEIIHHFHGNWTVDGLTKHLRAEYPTLVELERIALEKGVPVYETFQGTNIGSFTVLAPSRQRYLDLLPDLDKTPERKTTADSSIAGTFGRIFAEVAKAAIRFITETWNGETLSDNPEPTSASNESSIVQMAVLDGRRVVLTGDVGPAGLAEAADYAELFGSIQPHFIQVPHHGSRRNVTPAVLNRWLGNAIAEGGAVRGTAFCSAAKDDPDHPRKKVVNAFTRRGYSVHVTNGGIKWHHWGTPERATYSTATPEAFHSQVEE